MIMTADNLGISSALDVPVISDGEYVKRTRIHMILGERQGLASMACGVLPQRGTHHCGD